MYQKKKKKRKLDARNLISISSNNKIIFNQLWHLFVAITVTYFLAIISNYYYISNDKLSYPWLQIIQMRKM